MSTRTDAERLAWLLSKGEKSFRDLRWCVFAYDLQGERLLNYVREAIDSAMDEEVKTGDER